MTTDAEERRLLMLLADRYRFRTALERVTNILGPMELYTKDDTDHGCRGCRVDMAEALRVAEEALDG